MTTEIKRLLKKKTKVIQNSQKSKSTDNLKYKLKDAYNSYLTEIREGEDENKNKKFHNFF